jgi:flagellar basal-body rod protein FlgB
MLDRLVNNLNVNSQALTLRAERQKVLASNIANADTPNYKAVDFDFAKALSGALSGSATQNTGATNSPRLQYRNVNQPSLDANTVDMDLEQAHFADNTVRYEASLRFLNGQIRTMLSAITGQ